MNIDEIYFAKSAAAFVRGKLKNPIDGLNAIFNKALDELGEAELEELINLGSKNGLKLYPFKRSRDLPRIMKVLAYLKAIQPQNLLDIGSGRGAFLYPLMDNFPHLQILSIDLLKAITEDLQAVAAGGFPNLEVLQTEIQQLGYPDESFEVVTALEVIEHIPDTQKAIAAIYRLAKSHILISVPSKEDDNPEHIHLLNEQKFRDLFYPYPIKTIKFDTVQNHLLVYVRK